MQFFPFYKENKLISKFYYPGQKKTMLEGNNGYFLYFYNISN